MAEIVNLNRARKTRARAAEAAKAVENRVRAGRTGARKAEDRRAEQARLTALEGHRRTPPADEEPPTAG